MILRRILGIFMMIAGLIGLLLSSVDQRPDNQHDTWSNKA